MSTIQDSYEVLKDYINNKLNSDKSLFKTSNDEPTPLECCEEMLSKIPDSFCRFVSIFFHATCPRTLNCPITFLTCEG